VHDALLAGVPMLCLPQGTDNRGWCKRVEALGAGQIVEPDPDALRQLVGRLLGDEETHSRTAAIGRRLKQYDGEAVVASLIEQALDSSSVSLARRL
jgi:UDP:flavonoid glycosyltransferase YjiC (YdhE family)